MWKVCTFFSLSLSLSKVLTWFFVVRFTSRKEGRFFKNIYRTLITKPFFENPVKQALDSILPPPSTSPLFPSSSPVSMSHLKTVYRMECVRRDSGIREIEKEEEEEEG